MGTYNLNDDVENTTTNKPVETVGFWDMVRAAFESSFDDTYSASRAKNLELRNARYPEMKYVDNSMSYMGGIVIAPNKPPIENLLTKEQWTASPHYREGLSFDNMATNKGKVNEDVARLLAERKDKEIRLAEILEKSPDGFINTSAKYASMFAAQIIEPTNLAMLFVPILGEARYANVINKLGKLGKIGQVSAKVGANKFVSAGVRGAAEGGLGNVLMEPEIIFASKQEQSDYGIDDALLNVGFGSIFGAGIGLTGETGKYIFKNVFKHTPENIETIINDALNQIEEKGHFNVNKAIDIIEATKPLSKDPIIPNSVEELQNMDMVDDALLSPKETWSKKIADTLATDQKPLADDIVKLMNGEEVSKESKQTIYEMLHGPKWVSQTEEVGNIGDDLKKIFKNTLRSEAEDSRIVNEVKDTIVKINDTPYDIPASSDPVFEYDNDDVLRMFSTGEEDIIPVGGEPGMVDLTAAADSATQGIHPASPMGVWKNSYGATDIPKAPVMDVNTIPDKSDPFIFEPHSANDNIKKMEQDIIDLQNVMHNKGLKFASKMYDRKIMALTNEEKLRNRFFQDWLAMLESDLDIKYSKPIEGLVGLDSNLAKEYKEALNFRRNVNPEVDPSFLAKQLLAEYKEKQVANQRAFAYSLSKRMEADKFIKDFIAFDTTGKLTEYDALEAYILGKMKNTYGAGSSIDYLAKAHSANLLGHLENELLNYTDGNIPKGSLYDLSMKENKDLTKDIATELWNKKLSPADQIDTGNKIAKSLAEIFDKYQMQVLRRMNELGAYIKAMPGYIVKQTHNRVKMQNSGFEEWSKNISDLIDVDRTFGEKGLKGERLTKYLKEIYDDIMAGRYQEAMFDPSPMYNDSVTTRASASREIFFKDAKSWFNYNQIYGNEKTILKSIINGLDKAATNIALLEKLGPDPSSNLDAVINDTINTLKSTNPKDKAKRLTDINNGKRKLHSMLENVSGIANAPVNLKLSLVSNSTRQVINMSKLGMVTISSLADLPAAGAELTYNGIKFVDAWTGKFKYVMNQFGSAEEQKQFARLIGIGLEHINSDIINKFNAADGLTGIFDRAQKAFFKINLLQAWTDGMKRATGLQLSSHIGTNLRDFDYSKISIDLANSLKRYGIGELEWNLLRKAGRETSNEFFMPDSVKNIDVNDIVKYIKDRFKTVDDPKMRQLGVQLNKKSIDDVRYELENKMRTYFMDRVDSAVPTPGTSERMITYFDTKPGTILGESIRFLMQFKSYSITYARKVLGREMYMQSSNRLMHWTTLAVQSIAMAGIVGWTKDLLSGKEFRDYTNPQNWSGLIQQSGIAGIYGDTLLGMQKGYGKSPIDSMAGPGFDIASDTLGMAIDAKEGRFKSIPGSAANLVKNNIPFQNLFYTKLITDMLLTYSFEEALDPGSSRRKVKNLKKRTGQRYRKGFGPKDRVRTFE